MVTMTTADATTASSEAEAPTERPRRSMASRRRLMRFHRLLVVGRIEDDGNTGSRTDRCDCGKTWA